MVLSHEQCLEGKVPNLMGREESQKRAELSRLDREQYGCGCVLTVAINTRILVNYRIVGYPGDTSEF